MNKELPINQLKRHPARTKTTHLLLRQPNFISKPANPSFEAGPLACEASALTAELTAPKQSYFSPKNQLCKTTPLASSNFSTDLRDVLAGYQLRAAMEGKTQYHSYRYQKSQSSSGICDVTENEHRCDSIR
jgi:hypothetical protein